MAGFGLAAPSEINKSPRSIDLTRRNHADPCMRWVPGSQTACRPHRISEICHLYDATRPCRLACGSIYAPSTIQVGKLDGGSSKIMHARGCSRLGSRRVTSRAGMQQGNDNGTWPGHGHGALYVQKFLCRYDTGDSDSSVVGGVLRLGGSFETLFMASVRGRSGTFC